MRTHGAGGIGKCIFRRVISSILVHDLIARNRHSVAFGTICLSSEHINNLNTCSLLKISGFLDLEMSKRNTGGFVDIRRSWRMELSRLT